MSIDGVRALTFDVFGTVVDWRSSVAREAQALLGPKGFELDWSDFALRWRARYQPAMEEVRSGRRAWTILDHLHRENLVGVLDESGITGLSDQEIDHLNAAWHRLDPWPDVVEGLERLKPRYILATLSNGNVALMVDIANGPGSPGTSSSGRRWRAPTSRCRRPISARRSFWAQSLRPA